jgi:hypothetical protein
VSLPRPEIPAAASFYPSRIHSTRGNSSEPSQFERWRDALLGGVAASAFMLYGARPVRAACLGIPVLTCNTDISGTGVVNGGITVTGPTTTTVNVDNLSAQANTITPASGTSGIVFSSTTTPITINTSTITFGVPVNINATGTNADGINASGSTSTVQAITITSNGNISATRYGIFAQRSGTAASPVTVTSNIEGVSAPVEIDAADDKSVVVVGFVACGALDDARVGRQAGRERGRVE